MSGRGRVEVGATAIALTALAGEWLSHTLEYVRLSGLHGAFGSVHLYMGPIGVALVVAAMAAVQSTARLATRLESRLAELGGGGRLGTVPLVTRDLPASTLSWSVGSLVGMVSVTQCGLYVLQENLEAGVAHRVLPGMSVLTGAHAVAPLIHLAVSLGLVAALWLLRRPITHLAQVVRMAEDRLRSVRPPATAAVAAALPVRAWTPIDRWGSQLWSRPPPAFRVV